MTNLQWNEILLNAINKAIKKNADAAMLSNTGGDGSVVMIPLSSTQMIEAQRLLMEDQTKIDRAVLNGMRVKYHDDGVTMKRRENYINGKRHGLWETYHSNGSIWVRENFKHGKRHGLLEEFDSNGTLLWWCEWKNGEPIVEGIVSRAIGSLKGLFER